jgi:hypothetical protein
MIICGTGPHHNPGYKGNADEIFNETVARLKEVGHKMVAAVFTVGTSETPSDTP